MTLAIFDDAGNRVETAIVATTPRMKSQAAGKMGYSTTQVGDLVVIHFGNRHVLDENFPLCRPVEAPQEVEQC